MNTLQSVVDATTRFVPCQYPVQQNSGCDLIIVINLSLRFDFARSVDKPPGKTPSHLFVPRCPSFDLRHVFPFCTCVDEFRPSLTRAPPLHQASRMYGYRPLPGRIAPREGPQPYIRRPTRLCCGRSKGGHHESNVGCHGGCRLAAHRLPGRRH